MGLRPLEIKGPFVMESDSSEIVAWLQRWYLDHCNGDWEQSGGISISSMRSGWCVSIFLRGTRLRHLNTLWRETPAGNTEWYCYRFTSGTFEGIGGPKSLPLLLHTFRSFAEGGEQ